MVVGVARTLDVLWAQKSHKDVLYPSHDRSQFFYAQYLVKRRDVLTRGIACVCLDCAFRKPITKKTQSYILCVCGVWYKRLIWEPKKKNRSESHGCVSAVPTKSSLGNLGGAKRNPLRNRFHHVVLKGENSYHTRLKNYTLSFFKKCNKWHLFGFRGESHPRWKERPGNRKHLNTSITVWNILKLDETQMIGQ